jgi:hypothetical protein
MNIHGTLTSVTGTILSALPTLVEFTGNMPVAVEKDAALQK